MDIVRAFCLTKSARTAKRPLPSREWRSVFGLKDITSATNVAEAPRAHKEVVEANGQIRALIFATPKQPWEEKCPLLQSPV